MEWTNQKTLELIDLYRAKPCLWDPKSNFYKLPNKKNDAWNEISVEINCEVIEVKKKINSLLASFRRERQKEGTNKKSGSGTDEIYHSAWFAFKSLQFLLDKFQPRETQNTDENEIEGNQNSATQDTQSGFIQQEEEHACTDTSIRCNQRQKGKRSARDNRIDEAYEIMKETVAKKVVKNNNTIFGQYVASKMDSYSDRCKNIVQHFINNILFDADMGKFDVHPSSFSYPQTVNGVAYGYTSNHSLQSCNRSLQTSYTNTSLPSPASDQLSYISENQLSPIETDSETSAQPSVSNSINEENFTDSAAGEL